MQQVSSQHVFTEKSKTVQSIDGLIMIPPDGDIVGDIVIRAEPSNSDEKDGILSSVEVWIADEVVWRWKGEGTSTVAIPFAINLICMGCHEVRIEVRGTTSYACMATYRKFADIDYRRQMWGGGCTAKWFDDRENWYIAPW